MYFFENETKDYTFLKLCHLHYRWASLDKMGLGIGEELQQLVRDVQGQHVIGS